VAVLKSVKTGSITRTVLDTVDQPALAVL
jgi:hypothetical protein